MSKYHMLTTIPFLFYLWKTPIFFFFFFTGAVLIDFDHCVDFYLRFHRPTLSITELSQSLANRPEYLIPLHSIEFFFLILGSAFYLHNDNLWCFVTGFTVHYAFDILTNGYPNWKWLFLSYRITKWRDRIK